MAHRWSRDTRYTHKTPHVTPLPIPLPRRNIVVPAQANGAKVKVVSAMYQKSPLGLGLRPDSSIKSLRYGHVLTACVRSCMCIDA